MGFVFWFGEKCEAILEIIIQHTGNDLHTDIQTDEQTVKYTHVPNQPGDNDITFVKSKLHYIYFNLLCIFLVRKSYSKLYKILTCRNVVDTAIDFRSVIGMQSRCRDVP